MIHLTNGLGLIFEVGLAVFCFVDVLIAREAAVRIMPRWAWVVAILVFPVAGCLGYLAAGRPWRAAERAAGAAARPAKGTDGVPAPTSAAAPAEAVAPGGEDASLLVLMTRLNDEHEQMLTRWESDLRRREEALRAREQGDTAAA